MARAKRSAPLDRVEAPLVDEVERGVRAAGSQPIGKLTATKLTPSARSELLRLLSARGLEPMARAVRVPIEAQILTRIEGRARIPLKDLSKCVKGASKGELAQAIDRLVRADKARVVVRTQVEVLVGAADNTLAPAEIAQLGKLAGLLTKLIKKVSAKGRPRSLLREDLTALLTPLAAAARLPSPARDNASAQVNEALMRLEDPVLNLVRIPDLVRALTPALPLADIHRLLGEAADAGALELRPEAGGEFLVAADAALCPPGPRGTVFSYARRLRP